MRLYEVAKRCYLQSKNVKNKNRYYIIMNILKDPGALSKMKTDVAYRMIADLGFQGDDIKRIYLNVINEVML